MARAIAHHYQITRAGLVPLGSEAPPSLEHEHQSADVNATLTAAGWLTVTITQFDEDEPDYQRLMAGASRVEASVRKDPATYERFMQSGGYQPAMTLSKHRALLGDDEGEIAVPGIPHKVPISFKPWAAADPETTRLSITFTFRRTAGDLR
jgi:hypothetical protein